MVDLRPPAADVKQYRDRAKDPPGRVVGWASDRDNLAGFDRLDLPAKLNFALLGGGEGIFSGFQR